jgi:hypothetical protein
MEQQLEFFADMVGLIGSYSCRMLFIGVTSVDAIHAVRFSGQVTLSLLHITQWAKQSGMGFGAQPPTRPISL